jgi:hypothetical protein
MTVNRVKTGASHPEPGILKNKPETRVTFFTPQNMAA